MTRTLRGLCLTLAAVVAFCTHVVADEQLTKAIDRLVKREGFVDDGPGAAILVYQPGKIDFRKGYGFANLEAKTPITPRTMFELASVSKPFTATAILILQDRGKLSIDDDLRKHLPELPEFRSGPIRIRELLQHTSGLPEYMDIEDLPARHRTFWDNEDYIAEFARQPKQHPLDFPTGRKYEYCNTNYLLLGSIIARVSKKSYGTFLHDEIFVPLGMKHTFVYESPTSVPQPAPAGYECALGYQREKKHWQVGWGAPPARNEDTLSVGDGGVWTNLEDMAAWDAGQRSGKLLKSATIAKSHRPSHTTDGEQNDYGLGWELEFEEGKLTGYGHNGSWGGFRTLYYRDLNADRTMVILSNRGDFDPDDFWYPLNDLVKKHLGE